MFKPFICGASNHQQEDEHGIRSSSNSTPTKSKRNRFCKGHNKDKKDKKNPFSDLGLDKFSELLAELEEKRQKIYSQTGSEDIQVRFMYKNSTDCVPIVIKLKDKKKEERKESVQVPKVQHPAGLKNSDSQVLNIKHAIETLTQGKEVINKIARLQAEIGKTGNKKKQSNKKGFSWNIELHKWRRPSYYLPIIVVLILLLLVFFGRSVSILITCIAWYIVPTIPGQSSSKLRRPLNKKDYVRKLGQTQNRGSPVRDHNRKS